MFVKESGVSPVGVVVVVVVCLDVSLAGSWISVYKSCLCQGVGHLFINVFDPGLSTRELI